MMHRLVYVSNYLDVMIDSYHIVTTHTQAMGCTECCDISILQGCEVLEKVGGLHKFMGWNRALLTVCLFVSKRYDCIFTISCIFLLLG